MFTLPIQMRIIQLLSSVNNISHTLSLSNQMEGQKVDLQLFVRSITTTSIQGCKNFSTMRPSGTRSVACENGKIQKTGFLIIGKVTKSRLFLENCDKNHASFEKSLYKSSAFRKIAAICTYGYIKKSYFWTKRESQTENKANNFLHSCFHL